MKLSERFAAMPGDLEPTPGGAYLHNVPAAEGGNDDAFDQDGFLVQPCMQGGLLTQEEVIRWRYILGEGVEDKGSLKAFFVLGAGGSGKGAVSKDMLAGRGLKYINQDTHLERMLTDAGISLKKAGSDYGIFKKAQKLARTERDSYAEQRLGLHIEMTGWDITRVAKPVKMLRKLGYDVYAVIVHAKYDTVMARNKARAEAGGRLVPKHYISTAVRGLKVNMAGYVKLFGPGNTLIINNDNPIDSATWKRIVAPALTRAGDKFLARPVKNPIGKHWIADQRAAKQTESTTRPRLVMPPVLLETVR
jgi:hypothetical protein